MDFQSAKIHNATVDAKTNVGQKYCYTVTLELISLYRDTRNEVNSYFPTLIEFRARLTPVVLFI